LQVSTDEPAPEMAFEFYKKAPLRVDDGIPVFVEDDLYARNYEDIAVSHLDSLAHGDDNPYILNDDWELMEASTEALIERYTKPGDRLLDVGVGLGRLLSRFHDRERYGIDISLNYLRKSAALNINVARASAEELPHLDGYFDCLVSTDVLEHVKNLHQSVAECLRVVKAGGVLIIRVPIDEDLSPYLADDYPFEFAHLRAFSKASLHLIFTRIFRTHVVGFVPTRVFSDIKLKWPLGQRGCYVANCFLRWLCKGKPALRTAVLNACYNPMEMNIVVRKPEGS
jgi:2-polyprenyl-3-methyl-5-hydroxy-6-metoxy-1,4-benzoquinol methylase